MMDNVLFISGMMRSGTTLLQKVLNNHPQLNVSNQAVTENFISAIKKFHAEKCIKRYHVLSHYSDPVGYSFDELQEFLSMNFSLDTFFPDGNIGNKEVLAEEFFPFFLDKNVKCINVVRDPRDVIASMSFGKGEKYTGIERPVLFDLRNWRKSVHIGYICSSNTNFMQVKFEDLVLNSEHTLAQLLDFIGVEKTYFDSYYSNLSRIPWKGNSSFGDKKLFDNKAIANYHSFLPYEVLSYINTTCKQEMGHMGYDINGADEDDKACIRNYRDPFEIRRREFDSEYSSSKTNIEYELDRLDKSFAELNKRLFK